MTRLRPRASATFTLLALAAGAVGADAPPSLREALAAPLAARGATLERLAERGTPLVEGEQILFLIEAGDRGAPRLHLDINGFGRYPEAPGLAGARMRPIEGTDWYYECLELPPDAEIEYEIEWPDGTRSIDPLNPHRTITFGRPVSVVQMPAYQPSPYVRPDGEPLTGRLERFAIEGADRRVEVYLPPGYPQHAPYPTVYFNDGGFYLDEVGAHRTVDAMIREGALDPLIAVFVDPLNRGAEYRGLEGFPAFMADLVARIDRHYPTERDAARRAILGGSRGALGALHLVMDTEGVFGLAGLFAPAISYDPILETVAVGERRPVRFSMVGAAFDARFIGDYHIALDALRFKGYPVSHRVAPIGHSPTSWRRHIPVVLLDLLGPPDPES